MRTRFFVAGFFALVIGLASLATPQAGAAAMDQCDESCQNITTCGFDPWAESVCAGGTWFPCETSPCF